MPGNPLILLIYKTPIYVFLKLWKHRSALWHSELNSCPVTVPASPLLIQLLLNALRKAAEDGPGARAPAPAWETSMELQVLSFCLAESWPSRPLQPLVGWTSKCKILSFSLSLSLQFPLYQSYANYCYIVNLFLYYIPIIFFLFSLLQGRQSLHEPFFSTKNMMKNTGTSYVHCILHILQLHKTSLHSKFNFILTVSCTVQLELYMT